jgi:UDP:flavonoid glycosyltransferase YjiC (YdhE family)
MWFGKPMLVMPENTVEQRLNAAAVERMGIGMRVRADDVSAQLVKAWLAEEARFSTTAVRSARDGRTEAIAALETFTRELSTVASRAVARRWGYA